MSNDYSLATTTIVPLDVTPSVAWHRHALNSFVERMLDRRQPFPCVFGVDAVKRATLRSAFIDHGDAASLAQALGEFVCVAQGLGRRTSLVVFVGHEAGDTRARPISHYRDAFWKLLQDVHALDETPWPNDIPVDTEDPHFEFAFGGLPMFVVANTPAHVRRSSRYSEYFTMTFQPRFVFADIPADSVQGQNARAIIRERLRHYDATPRTPLLGNFGQVGNQEWKQYFLDDDNSNLLQGRSCPFRVKGHPMDEHTTFAEVPVPAVPDELLGLLPEQGSYEIQNDRAAKTHAWHEHSVDEDLLILAGEALLFWVDGGDGGYRERVCTEGTAISLPAGTVHGSTAGPEGAVYIIRPRGGQVAETRFLAEDSHPYPVPDRVAHDTGVRPSA